MDKPTDTTTGLTSVGARYLDAATGRFVSLDPLFEADDTLALNGYGYTSDNPVTEADPSGQHECIDGCGSADDQSVNQATAQQRRQQQWKQDEANWQQTTDQAENQAIDDCTSNACINHAVRNVNSLSYEIALNESYYNQQVAAQIATRYWAAKLAADEKTRAAAIWSHGCGFLGSSCAYHWIHSNINAINWTVVISTAVAAMAVVATGACAATIACGAAVVTALTWTSVTATSVMAASSIAQSVDTCGHSDSSSCAQSVVLAATGTVGLVGGPVASKLGTMWLEWVTRPAS
jgi:RHS repeat-associated protein